MEVKNGIIIDGVLHEMVSIAGRHNSDERFINRGKVTDIKIDKDNKQ